MTDEQWAELLEWLAQTGQEAHTTKGQTLIVRPRRRKRIAHGRTKGQLR